MAAVNYVLSQFEGKNNPGDTTRLEIGKENENLDISVSNAKYIVYQFIILCNKYDWGLLVLMVVTYNGTNENFRLVEKIKLGDIQKQSHG